MKEKDLSCIGLVFTTCSVLRRLLHMLCEPVTNNNDNDDKMHHKTPTSIGANTGATEREDVSHTMCQCAYRTQCVSAPIAHNVSVHLSHTMCQCAYRTQRVSTPIAHNVLVRLSHTMC